MTTGTGTGTRTGSARAPGHHRASTVSKAPSAKEEAQMATIHPRADVASVTRGVEPVPGACRGAAARPARTTMPGQPGAGVAGELGNLTLTVPADVRPAGA